MSVDRLPLFCGIELAERIERVEVQLVSAASRAAHARGPGFVIPIAGGIASFAEAHSPFNKVAGLGFGGRPSAAALDEIEDAFAEFGAAVQIELPSLGDPAIGGLLTSRSYRLESFENVLGIALSGSFERVTPPGVEVHPSPDDDFDTWLEVLIDAGAHPDVQGVPEHEVFPHEIIDRATRDLVAAAGVRRYTARHDGVLAGGGTMRMSAGVAQFTGASTAPDHRRHGIQTALLATRLADAAAAGCDVAVVTTQPGSKSQQNVQRSGFDLLYTRAILVKDRGRD